MGRSEGHSGSIFLKHGIFNRRCIIILLYHFENRSAPMKKFLNQVPKVIVITPLHCYFTIVYMNAYPSKNCQCASEPATTQKIAYLFYHRKWCTSLCTRETVNVAAYEEKINNRVMRILKPGLLPPLNSSFPFEMRVAK